MSSGHRYKHDLTNSELDDLLDEALAFSKVQAFLRQPFTVVTSYDVPLLGSSNIGWTKVYFDRHFPISKMPVGDRTLNAKPGLIRHERLEVALENILNWPYDEIAHPVAQHFEDRDYRWRGFDPKAVEKAYEPYIRDDESEVLKKVATDLDLRPMLFDKKLMEATKSAQDKEKLSRDKVGYIDHPNGNQRCAACSMFVAEAYGGPGCVLVKSPISPRGWCHRFDRGALDKPKVA
jgi:hypothetical protein